MMRHILVIVLLTLQTVFSLSSQATPVYLRLDSQFPSGNHSRQWLESHTKKVQFQRWIRVQVGETQPNSKAKKTAASYGWLPEDHLLSPLKLASQASLTEDLPVRDEKEMDAIGSKMLLKNTTVLILEISGSWAYVQPLPASENRPSWVPTDGLRTLVQSQAQRGYVRHNADLYLSPRATSRKIDQVRAGKYVTILKGESGWNEMSWQGGSVWIKHADLWTIEDLGENGARPLSDGLLLRSNPLPYADVIRTVDVKTSLTMIGSKVQRWGLVHVAQTGDLWWPISEDSYDDKDPQFGITQKVLTKDLFARKIFDMASSVAIPSLKFASAQGIFRTMDGQEWAKIALFKGENYPIAIARGGPVFIGPYISEDQGETFQTWIRYDKLVATLKSRWTLTPRSLQILEIKPEDLSGKRLTLKLNIGLSKPVRAATEDQGRTWRAL